MIVNYLPSKKGDPYAIRRLSKSIYKLPRFATVSEMIVHNYGVILTECLLESIFEKVIVDYDEDGDITHMDLYFVESSASYQSLLNRIKRGNKEARAKNDPNIVAEAVVIEDWGLVPWKEISGYDDDQDAEVLISYRHLHRLTAVISARIHALLRKYASGLGGAIQGAVDIAPGSQETLLVFLEPGSAKIMGSPVIGLSTADSVLRQLDEMLEGTIKVYGGRNDEKFDTLGQQP